MGTWFEYRDAWSRRPWLAALAALAVIMLIVGIVGTVGRNLLMVLFIPGLLLLLGHHFAVQRLDEQNR